jgi:hypothetical protein
LLGSNPTKIAANTIVETIRFFNIIVKIRELTKINNKYLGLISTKLKLLIIMYKMQLEIGYQTKRTHDIPRILLKTIIGRTKKNLKIKVKYTNCTLFLNKLLLIKP